MMFDKLITKWYTSCVINNKQGATTNEWSKKLDRH